MADILDQIVDDMVAKLVAGAGVGGIPTAERMRTFGIDANKDGGRSIIVYLDKTRVVQRKGRGVEGLRMLVADVAVEIRAASTETTRPDQELAPMRAWATAKLDGQTRGVSDSGAPIYHSIEEDETEYGVDQADHGYLLARMIFKVTYQTKAGAADVWA